MSFITPKTEDNVADVINDAEDLLRCLSDLVANKGDHAVRKAKGAKVVITRALEKYNKEKNNDAFRSIRDTVNSVYRWIASL